MATAQAERRRQILEAAVRAFARKGYHATRVGEIAEEAGVAYGLVYHYFGSKEEVARDDLPGHAGRRCSRACAKSGRRAARPRTRSRKVTALLLRTWRRDPDLVRVLVREVTRSPGADAAPDRRDRRMPTKSLETIVVRGQETGEFRADVDAAGRGYRLLRRCSRKSCTGWVMGQLPDADEDIARAEHVVTAMLVARLSAKPLLVDRKILRFSFVS